MNKGTENNKTLANALSLPDRANDHLATWFQHIEDVAATSLMDWRALENDVRRALHQVYSGELDSCVAVYVIDAIVNFHTGRGTEMEW